MFTRLLFGTTGALADNDHLTGALIFTVAAMATAEVFRPLRLINLAFGSWLLAAPWLLNGGTRAHHGPMSPPDWPLSHSAWLAVPRSMPVGTSTWSDLLRSGFRHAPTRRLPPFSMHEDKMISRVREFVTGRRRLTNYLRARPAR